MLLLDFIKLSNKVKKEKLEKSILRFKKELEEFNNLAQKLQEQQEQTKQHTL
ncbi:MAG: hypothetical protein RBR40_15230 [Tenuifilaceae bacterium]|nr:hypothetical protein [Tenuifilaceae bacterium]